MKSDTTPPTEKIVGVDQPRLVLPLYSTGEQVRAGDRVRIGKADCTVIRFIPSMTVVTIDGIPNFKHGVGNIVFSKLPRPPQWRMMSEDMLASMSSECDRCCSDKSRVLTVSIDDRLYDGDMIECMDCKRNGTISVVDGEAYCLWDDLSEWPCQQLHGGRDAAVMDQEDNGGMCQHPECDPVHAPNKRRAECSHQYAAAGINTGRCIHCDVVKFFQMNADVDAPAVNATPIQNQTP